MKFAERPRTARLFFLIFPKKHSLIAQNRFLPFFNPFFGFFHSQFGPIFTKNGQKYVILGLKRLNIHLYGMTAAVVVSDLFLVYRRSRWRPKDSRPSVRPYVTRLLENRSLLFSETAVS